GRPRLPGARARPQTFRPPEARPAVVIDALRRRALINGGIAAGLTLAIGAGIVAGISAGGDSAPPPVAPTTTPTTPPPPPCTPTFDVALSADPGEASNWLNDVVALSSAEAWAVGASGAPEVPTAVLIERWDGVAWTAEEGPSPGSQFNELRGVDASGPNDVWAVGRKASGFGDRPLVLHFDGSEWLEVAPPDEITGSLNGVAAFSPSEVWAVGSVGDPAAMLEESLVLHWDGTEWTEVDPGRAVGQARSALLDVGGLGPTDLWAAGYRRNTPLLIHFDGLTWTRTDSNSRGPTNAIRPVSGTDVWAVGVPLLRYDGAEWTEEDAIRAEEELFGVAAVSPEDVWAVGHRRVGEGERTRSTVLRFDGAAWSNVEGASFPGSDALVGIAALPDGTILAVGYKDVEAGRRTAAIIGSTCPPAG
ncbi:MAG TPA: hypothetical protein VLA90_03615, partial [Actinomycetota bacterium]|nr:hypothetical protein [Actinomycetota bacterium]